MNEYRKTATVTARKVGGTQAINVYSLEGPAIAHPGDYIVTAKTGESWVVAGPIFESTYEPIQAGTRDQAKQDGPLRAIAKMRLAAIWRIGAERDQLRVEVDRLRRTIQKLHDSGAS